MKEENIIPIAHLLYWPVCLFFTGINLIIPYRISPPIKLRNEANTTSNGTIVLTKLLIKNELNTPVNDPAIQAYTVCPPTGIFANVEFIACSTSTTREL